MTPAPFKIAIIKLSALGDVIHALPVARALRRARPDAELTWIVEAREYALLRDHPDLDRVIPVNTRLWRRLIWRPSGAREVWGKLGRLRTRMRGARFDVALDLQGLVKSGLLTAYTGAGLRIGFSASHCRERLNALFTNRHVTPPPQAVHVVEQYLSLLEPLGLLAAAPEFHDAANGRRGWRRWPNQDPQVEAQEINIGCDIHGVRAVDDGHGDILEARGSSLVRVEDVSWA